MLNISCMLHTSTDVCPFTYVLHVTECFLYCFLIHNICKKYYQHEGIIAGAVCKIKKCHWHASHGKQFFKHQYQSKYLYIIHYWNYCYNFRL